MQGAPCVHAYGRNSELYHIKPGCVPPEGLVLLLNQEDVDEMVRAHQDTKKCDLYIVANHHFRGDGYDESDEVGYIANLVLYHFLHALFLY